MARKMLITLVATLAAVSPFATIRAYGVYPSDPSYPWYEGSIERANREHPKSFGLMQQDTLKLDVLTASEVDLGAYRADMERRVKRAWFPPKSTNSIKLLVDATFSIDGSGKLIDAKIVGASEDPSYDKKALEALKNCTFKAIPSPAQLSRIDGKVQFKSRSFLSK